MLCRYPQSVRKTGFLLRWNDSVSVFVWVSGRGREILILWLQGYDHFPLYHPALFVQYRRHRCYSQQAHNWPQSCVPQRRHLWQSAGLGHPVLSCLASSVSVIKVCRIIVTENRQKYNNMGVFTLQSFRHLCFWLQSLGALFTQILIFLKLNICWFNLYQH